MSKVAYEISTAWMAYGPLHILSDKGVNQKNWRGTYATLLPGTQGKITSMESEAVSTLFAMAKAACICVLTSSRLKVVGSSGDVSQVISSCSEVKASAGVFSRKP